MILEQISNVFYGIGQFLHQKNMYYEGLQDGLQLAKNAIDTEMSRLAKKEKKRVKK
jgi:hypothetical protein